MLRLYIFYRELSLLSETSFRWYTHCVTPFHIIIPVYTVLYSVYSYRPKNKTIVCITREKEGKIDKKKVKE